jgi:MFS superfamily sulfate permease-like transporter
MKIPGELFKKTSFKKAGSQKIKPNQVAKGSLIILKSTVIAMFIVLLTLAVIFGILAAIKLFSK